MIDYIHEMCEEWGDYMRKNPRCWPSKNTAWRLCMEQGASSHEHGPSNPDWTMREDAGEVHRIWRRMPEELNSLMWIIYVKRNWNYERKAQKMGISRSKLFELRSNLHYYIAGRLQSERPDDQHFVQGVS